MEKETKENLGTILVLAGVVVAVAAMFAAYWLHGMFVVPCGIGIFAVVVGGKIVGKEPRSPRAISEGQICLAVMRRSGWQLGVAIAIALGVVTLVGLFA